MVLTAGHADFGQIPITFAAKWVRHLCHEAPGRFAAMASTLPGVRVGGDQQGAGEAAGDQVGEERVPRLFSLAGGDLDAEDLAVAVGVDAGRDEDDGIDDSALLTDLHGQGVGGDERERPGLAQGPGPERVDLFVEVGGHP
jgi:hypothetical protein